MDVRGKLVELLTEFYGCDPMYYGVDALAIAQHLMAHGVTVQEWISVKDRLPEEEARVLVYLDSNRSYTKTDTDRLINSKWVRWDRDVTHWMPLPEPPKGE